MKDTYMNIHHHHHHQELNPPPVVEIHESERALLHPQMLGGAGFDVADRLLLASLQLASSPKAALSRTATAMMASQPQLSPIASMILRRQQILQLQQEFLSMRQQQRHQQQPRQEQVPALEFLQTMLVNNARYSHLQSWGGIHLPPAVEMADAITDVHEVNVMAGVVPAIAVATEVAVANDSNERNDQDSSNTIRNNSNSQVVLSDAKMIQEHINQEKEHEEQTFPHKLYRMLMYAERVGLDHIVSFLPDGDGFAIRKPQEFATCVMPWYFSTKLSSFFRQLNMYGFKRCTEGINRGSFSHKQFLKGRPELCKNIERRRKVSSSSQARADCTDNDDTPKTTS